ncbi:multidrug effflux MFS transporter [Isoptericola sp. b441]|uniref:Multidrug effflux MFS transporter n=1 Tax=Actinotalea lenta TaxID=3064654 RepID=A0ABT9D7U0_9CELL|nr:multidrug effflux MFS transporter [Isoptericola sp. b441]MDO8106934.1 multidrug effflux MFS transporter [Isoptericola sp. b441]
MTRRPVPTTAASGSRLPASFVMLIGSFTLLPAMSTDMYLPSLPQVATDLGTTAAGAQFTITGMVLGGAAGQLIVGPLSDRVGRRKPALVAVSGHVLISLLCAIAPSIGVLAGLRLLQGFFAASGIVTAIAVVRDRYTGSEVARLMSRLMLVIAAAPMLAPSIGTVVAGQWGWRAVFLVLAGVGGALLVFALLRLPESLPPERRQRHGVGALARGYLDLLRDKRFRALAVLPGMAQAVVISYVAGSPFVLREQFGLSGGQFSLVFALGGASLVAGSQLNAGLVRRISPSRLLRVGAPAMAGSSAVLVVMVVGGVGGVLGLLVPLWCALFALGFVTSNASALALSRHGERAGTAAATIGALQSGVAGSVSPLVGLLGGDAVAMTSVILGTAVVALLVLGLATPIYRRQGWVALDAPGSDPSPDLEGAGLVTSAESGATATA